MGRRRRHRRCTFFSRARRCNVRALHLSLSLWAAIARFRHVVAGNGPGSTVFSKSWEDERCFIVVIIIVVVASRDRFGAAAGSPRSTRRSSRFHREIWSVRATISPADDISPRRFVLRRVSNEETRDLRARDDFLRRDYGHLWERSERQRRRLVSLVSRSTISRPLVRTQR